MLLNQVILSDVLYVADIAVLPEYRRQGFGKASLLHLRAEALRSKASALAASVWEGNDASHALFKSQGFVSPIRDYVMQTSPSPAVKNPPFWRRFVPPACMICLLMLVLAFLLGRSLGY